jgi:hypothetical protein
MTDGPSAMAEHRATNRSGCSSASRAPVLTSHRREIARTLSASIPVPAFLMRGASDKQHQHFPQPQGRPVKAFAGIDVLDLDDPA